jgi:hypothetical protein
MGLTLHYDHGQTPLNEDEIHGLLISSVTTKRELDEQEQLNILKMHLSIICLASGQM